jgi:hypothetical protein
MQCYCLAIGTFKAEDAIELWIRETHSAEKVGQIEFADNSVLATKFAFNTTGVVEENVLFDTTQRTLFSYIFRKECQMPSASHELPIQVS